MTWTRTALRRARESRQGDDEGFSLMETLVATSIFAVFMSLVMLAIISMMSSTQKSQSLTDGATNLENVFQKLDHQVRYANGIEPPGQVGGNWFVEWQSQPVTTSPQTCTELKYNTTAHTLLERSWQPLAPVITPTSWILLAPNITNPAATDPFTFQPSGPIVPGGPTVYAHQQLTVTLMDRPGGTNASTSTLSNSATTFTALNSSTKTGNVCQEVARS